MCFAVFFTVSFAIYFAVLARSWWRYSTAFTRYYEMYRRKIDPSMPPRTLRGSWCLFIGRTRAPRDYMSPEWFSRMPDTWTIVSKPQDDPELDTARLLARERRIHALVVVGGGWLLILAVGLVGMALTLPH